MLRSDEKLRKSLLALLEKLYHSSSEDAESSAYSALDAFFNNNSLDKFKKYFDSFYWSNLSMRSKWLRWRWTEGVFRATFAITSTKVSVLDAVTCLFTKRTLLLGVESSSQLMTHSLFSALSSPTQTKNLVEGHFNVLKAIVGRMCKRRLDDLVFLLLSQVGEHFRAKVSLGRRDSLLCSCARKRSISALFTHMACCFCSSAS